MAEEQIFPFANIIVGLLILILGGGLHWLGQLISVINWDLAMKLGIVDEKITPEYKTYEHGIAMADSILGWIYTLAAIGLILDYSWAYELIWIPAAIFIYHGISFYFWVGNQTKLGKPTYERNMHIFWPLINIGIGLLGILIALSY